MLLTKTYILPLGAAFCASFVVNLLLSSRWLRHIGLDTPGHRSLHQQPTPRLGGLGIVAGLICAQLLSDIWPLTWIIAAAILICISFIDDLRPLPPQLRFMVQMASSLMVLNGPLTDSYGYIALASLLVACVWSINLYNFMDGANGLAGGMGLIGFGCLGWIAAQGATNLNLSLTCFAIASACAGFLCFNFGKARIFMGDVGSTLLGLMVAVVSIAGFEEGVWPFWLPLMVFSPFIADASATLARRVANKQRFWQPHREHFYQKLIQMGWSHTKLALAAYLIMLACGGLAMSLQHTKNSNVIFLWLALLCIYGIIGSAIQTQWNRFVAQH